MWGGGLYFLGLFVPEVPAITVLEIGPFHEYPCCGYPLWSCSTISEGFFLIEESYANMQGGMTLGYPPTYAKLCGLVQAFVTQFLRLQSPYTAVSTPPSPEVLKSLKSLKKVFPGLLARSVKKVSKKSQRTRKGVKKVSKSVFGNFFNTFLTLRAGRPGKTFLRLFGDFGARGVETPVYGDCNHSPIRTIHSALG